MHGVVTEWTADDPAADTFAGTSREVLRIGFAGQIHGIQQIDFNPTAQPGDEDYGLLYLAVGDGGIGVSTTTRRTWPRRTARSCGSTRAGTNGPNGQYGIPATNPFVGQAGALGEIYAVGMRDPHRFSWDAGGEHRMYLGHIGEHAIEAVYEVRAGDNFGWSEREGRFVYRQRRTSATSTRCPTRWRAPATPTRSPRTTTTRRPTGPATPTSATRSPAASSTAATCPGCAASTSSATWSTAGCSTATGARCVDGGDTEATIHELALFDTDGTRMRMTDFVGDGRVDLRFGTDSAGDLYLLAKANGKVWKVVGTKRAPWPKEVAAEPRGRRGRGVRLRAPVRGRRRPRGGPGCVPTR